MRLDLSCPIELRGYTLTLDADGLHAQLRLYNLTGRRVAAFEAVAKWRCSARNQSVARPFSAQCLRAAGEAFFTHTVSNAVMPDADGFELLFTRVRFEDGGDDWRGGDGPFAEIELLPPIESDALRRLRAVVGEDAVCYPKQESLVWRCVCGRTNSNADDVCARCHRDHLDALACTPERIAAREAPDDVRPADDVRPRRRPRRRMLAMLALGLALAALLLMRAPAAPGRALLAVSETSK